MTFGRKVLKVYCRIIVRLAAHYGIEISWIITAIRKAAANSIHYQQAATIGVAQSTYYNWRNGDGDDDPASLKPWLQDALSSIGGSQGQRGELLDRATINIKRRRAAREHATNRPDFRHELENLFDRLVKLGRIHQDGTNYVVPQTIDFTSIGSIDEVLDDVQKDIARAIEHAMATGSWKNIWNLWHEIPNDVPVETVCAVALAAAEKAVEQFELPREARGTGKKIRWVLVFNENVEEA